MKTITQSIVLNENRHWGAKPPAGAVGEVLRLITPAVQYAIRMRFEGRSSFRGVRPAWLDAASDVRFIGREGRDETTLLFEMPQLGEAAPKLYEQKELWPTRPEPTDTGFDLLGDVIRDVAARDTDSERYDNSLLRKIGRFDHALNGTFQSLDIVAQRYSPAAPAQLRTREGATPTLLTSTKWSVWSRPATAGKRIHSKTGIHPGNFAIGSDRGLERWEPSWSSAVPDCADHRLRRRLAARQSRAFRALDPRK